LSTIANLALNAALASVPQERVQVSAPQEPAPAASEAAGSRWTDPEDGWFDVSSFLEHPAGFLPVVIPITEPALGYGAVVGAAFLHPREEAGAEGWVRPDMTFAAGMGTENGSEGVFGGNSSLWNDGNFQTLVAGGSMGLELSLHGIGEDPELEDDALDYRLDLNAALGECRQRLGESPWWLGLRFTYAHANVDFEGPASGTSGVDPDDEHATLSGPALTMRYDSLDSFFTPSSGALADTSVSVFGEAFGGTQDFQLFQQILIEHWPLSERFFFGVRGQFNASFGETPFYARPYIHLRGIPDLRYQGEQAASAELELRWQFHPRIALVGFGGGGTAWTELEDFDRQQSVLSGGLGGRYVLASKFGLQIGLDVAQGPEDTAIYFQFGNAWLMP
jgi:hypothetical protein